MKKTKTPCNKCNQSASGRCEEHPGIKPEPALKTLKVRCPYCDGSGKVLVSLRYKKVTQEQDTKAFALRKEGYTYREIGKMIGIRGPQSVKIAVEREGRRLLQEKL